MAKHCIWFVGRPIVKTMILIWVLYREVFLKRVLQLAVFAEEGPKKGVGLINGLLLLGLQSGGGGGGVP